MVIISNIIFKVCLLIRFSKFSAILVIIIRSQTESFLSFSKIMELVKDSTLILHVPRFHHNFIYKS